MTKIFAIGVTGWVGGTSAQAIAAQHPEYSWTVLLRNESKKESVLKFLPAETGFIIGDFDSHDVISAAAAAADITINWGSSDYEPLTKSILDGMQSKKGSMGYLLHTTGGGILVGDIITQGKFGQATSKIYDDWEHASELLELPPTAPHMNVDGMILAAQKETPQQLKVLLACPPIIYGMSSANDTRERSASKQYVNSILKHGRGFAVGDGKATVGTVHIRDLVQFFVKATEAAAQGDMTAWDGTSPYYFVENGEMVWGEFAEAVTKAAFAKGLLQSPDVEYLDADAAEKVDPMSKVGFGSSARSKAVRAYKTLGWKPEMHDIYKDTLENWRFQADAPHLFM